MKECGEHFQRKGNSKLQPEMRESHSENIEEGKDEWDAEMREWIELHKRDVLALDNGEHHIISISSPYNAHSRSVNQVGRKRTMQVRLPTHTSYQVCPSTLETLADGNDSYCIGIKSVVGKRS